MFNKLRTVSIALFTVIIILSTANSAVLAEDYGDFSCNSEELLRDSVAYWLPVDEESGETVNNGCTVLPGDFVPDNSRKIGEAKADCVSHWCEIDIEEALYKGRLYYIARGWMEQTDPDASEELVIVDFPQVPIGIPCELFACEVQPEIVIADH